MSTADIINNFCMRKYGCLYKDATKDQQTMADVYIDDLIYDAMDHPVLDDDLEGEEE